MRFLRSSVDSSQTPLLILEGSHSEYLKVSYTSASFLTLSGKVHILGGAFKFSSAESVSLTPRGIQSPRGNI